MINGLSERLRDLRLKSGYSQQLVAKQLGVSPSIISGYETGERTPSVEVLLALSYLYRCSTDYLLGRDAAVPEQTISAAGMSSRQIRALTEFILAKQEGHRR